MRIYLDPKRNFPVYDVVGVFDIEATSIDVVCANQVDIPNPATEGMYDILVYNAQYAHPNLDTKREYIRVGAMSWSDGIATLSGLLRGQQDTDAEDHNIANTTYRAILTWSKKDRDDINSALNTVMNSIGGRSVIYDEALTAGDIVKIINDGGPKAQKIIQNLSTPEVPIDLSVSITRMAAAPLSETKMAVVYVSSTNACNLAIYDIVDNGRQIVMMSSTGIPGATPYSSISLVSLLSTKLVFTIRENTTHYTKCWVIDVGSDNSLTIGSAQLPYGSFDADDIHVCVITSSRIVVVCEYSSKAVIGDISGRTISWGTVGTYNSSGNAWMPALTLLNSTSFVVLFFDTTLKAVVCTISGSTISAGTPTSLGPTNVAHNSICALSATKVVIAYSGGGYYGMVVVGNISGSTITIQTPVTFYENQTDYSYIIKLTSSSFIVSWNPQDVYQSRAQIGTVSGNNITMEGSAVISYISNDDISVYNPLVVLSTTKAVTVVNPGYATIYNVSNNILTNRRNIILDGLSGSYVVKAISISGNKFVIVINDDGMVKAMVGTVVNDVVTIGTVASYNAGSIYSYVDKLSDSSFILVYGTSTINGLVATISGSTVTFASPTQLSSTVNCKSVIVLANGLFVAVGSANSGGYGHAVLGEVSGTVVTLVGDYVFKSSSISNPVLVKMSDDSMAIAYYLASDSKEYIVPGFVRNIGLVFGIAKVLDSAGSNLPTSISGVNIQQGKSIIFFNTTALSPEGPKVLGCILTIPESYLLMIGSESLIKSAPYVPMGIACDKMAKDVVVVGMTNPNSSSGSHSYEYYFIKIIDDNLLFISESINASRATSASGIAALTNSIFASCYLESGILMAKVFQDDRSLATGIVQESGDEGAEESVALMSDVSAVHTGLEIDETYYLDRYGNITTTPSPWKLGRAVSETEIKLTIGS